ncbi:alpha-2,8-sialyltransferase 8B-like [Diadema setosum]|uniref:alpha-2,8-sialyltransferase 8B-like n=1 Tax=Diadema setosum TaxID=31175 RepID=UPI003B3AC05F
MRKAFSKRRTLGETLQLFKSGIPPMDMRFSSNVKKIARLNQTIRMNEKRTCAIIGNSGVLIDSKCGRLIDTSDLVIRMNLALFGGEFDSDVGTKVSLMTLNSGQYRHLTYCTDNYGNITIDVLPRVCCELLTRLTRMNGSTLWYSGSMTHNDHLKTALTVLRDFYNLHFNFAYSPAEIKSEVTKVLKLRAPSSGMAVYAAATHFCSRIQLFGFFPFYKDPTNRTLFTHYYEHAKMNYTTNRHKMPDEFGVLLELDKRGALRIVNDCSGKWNNDILRERLKHDGHLKGDEFGDFDINLPYQPNIEPR